MADELNQLRHEVARLRRDLDHVLRVLGQEEKLPQQPRPPFLLLDAEVISIRHSADKMPILLKAEEGYACIYLNDNDGRARGLFQIDENGSARFEIWNKDQEVVVSIGETKDGAGEIFVASADGKPRAGLKVHELGGIVSAQNSAGQTNVLMLGKDQGGTFVFFKQKTAYEIGLGIPAEPLFRSNHTRSSISDDIRNILCSSANMRRAIPLILRLLMN